MAQRRKRVFVIASARDIDPSEILFEFDGVRSDTPPSREAGKGSTEAVGGCSESHEFYRWQNNTAGIVHDVIAPTLKAGNSTDDRNNGGMIVTWSADIACCLDTQYGTKMGQNNQHINSGAPLFVPVTYPIHDKATRNGGERGCGNGLGIGSPTDPCPTLDTGGNHAVACLMDQGGAVMHVEDNMTGTLRRETHGHEPIIAQQMQVRRLTPTECEALQGFPRNWTDVPYRNKPAADGPRYKSLGNSMAVPVMNWIGRRINDALIRLG